MILTWRGAETIPALQISRTHPTPAGDRYGDAGNRCWGTFVQSGKFGLTQSQLRQLEGYGRFNEGVRLLQRITQPLERRLK